MAKRSQRIVLKFGSGILATDKGVGLSRKQIARHYTAERVAGDLYRLYSELFDGKCAKTLRRS